MFSTCCSELSAGGFMPNYIVLVEDRQQVTKLKQRLWTSNHLFQRAAQLSNRAELDDASSLKVKRQTNILIFEEETNCSVARKNQSQISSTGHLSGSPDHHLLTQLAKVCWRFSHKPLCITVDNIEACTERLLAMFNMIALLIKTNHKSKFSQY